MEPTTVTSLVDDMVDAIVGDVVSGDVVALGVSENLLGAVVCGDSIILGASEAPVGPGVSGVVVGAGNPLASTTASSDSLQT